MRKKIIPYILITLILVNLFAPFSLGISRNNSPEIRKSVAEAAEMQVRVVATKRTGTLVDISFIIHRKESDNHKLFYVLTDIDGTTLKDQKTLYALVDMEIAGTNLRSPDQVFNLPQGAAIFSGSGIGVIDFSGDEVDPTDSTYYNLTKKVVMTGLTPNHTYYLSVWGYNGSKVSTSITGNDQLNKPFSTTAGEEDTGVTTITEATTESADGNLPWCAHAVFSISLSGCIAQVLYYLLFTPTSFLFEAAGKFFDYTFFYSVKDTSYRTPFVLEGWGLVRDFVNLFFIFVLLYIAFSTILSVNGFKTKEMIKNVVIIGLLINFSMFATQIIIDTSNILARVFYTSITTGNDKDASGSVVSKLGAEGEVQLSGAIVDKVDPQKLIIQANKVSVTDKGRQGVTANSNSKGISNVTFIFVTLLATAVNVTGFIVFLMVGLIFVARVIGLWLAMIFVPLAFFSYTVPAMQDIDMFGWKKWWPNTLKLAFLAPIFIFFLYLILKFLNTGSIIADADTKTGGEFIIAIIVPFAFIMILLNTAKKLATKFAGDIGSAVTKAAVVGGGLALGGAALGAAFAGRTLIGKTMGAASQTDSAKHLGKYKAGLRDFNVKTKEHAVNMQIWRAGGSVGPRPTAPVAPRAPIKGEQLGFDKKGNAKYYKPGVFTSLGASLNAKQARIEKSDHEAHEVDSTKDKRYKGTDWKDLSGTQQNNVREDYIKDNRSKHKDDVEEAYRNDGVRNHTGGVIAASTPLDARQRKEVTDETTKVTGAKFDHAVAEASKSISSFSRNLAKVNTASFDARNISQMKSSGRGNFLNRTLGGMSAGLIAGIALGVRTGLKNSVGINHGSGQNDFLKDIGHTITEALKSAKINVKVEESTGKGGSDGHSAGAGHH